ncbi:MAG TPA: zf-HC2 domain-containing protein [Ktedonobacterales bacterium]
MRYASFGPHKEWAAQLIALYHGELTARERAAVEAHVAGCQRCARAYATYQEVAGAMQKLPGLLPSVPPELPQAEQGEHTLEYQQQFPQQKVAETPQSQGTYSSGYRRRSGKTEGATRRRKKPSTQNR